MLCNSCGERPAAFQIQHPETSLHWRCLRCMRTLAFDSGPFVVFGATTKARTTECVDRVAAGAMTDAMIDARRIARRIAGGKPDGVRGG